MNFARPFVVLALAAHGLVFAAGASAATAPYTTFYSFVGVGDPSANSADVAMGTASLSVEVIDLGIAGSGAHQVAFTFTNASSASLTDVYFDDGSLLGIASAEGSGTGVDFSQVAAPGNLPGGNNLTPGFTTTAGFSADSNPPVSLNGVSQGEWLTITFDLISGQDYQSVIDALALPNGGGPGDLRIGLHVQGFPGGGSASFVNVPDGISVPVPEAKTYAMLLAGLGLVGFMAARYRTA